MKARILGYLVVVLVLNIILTALSLRGVFYPREAFFEIGCVSFALFLYSIIAFGYRRFLNIIFIISILISYTVFSYTGSLYYSDYHQAYRFYPDLPNTAQIYQNLLIGVFSVLLLLVLSMIKNKYISKYSQIIVGIFTMLYMLLNLFFVFFQDM